MTGAGNALARPTIDLTDRVAVVTGSGGGIGRGIAMRLAEAGATVAVLDIDPARATRTADDIAVFGTAVPLTIDMMDAEAVRRGIAEIDGRFGRIDILVNNVGGVAAKPFLQQSPRSWQRHIDINFTSMLVATAEVAPIMIRNGRGGAIINVTSSEASRAAPNFAVYAACKAAMGSFTKSLALELAEHGIRVNAIAPDHIATPGAMGLAKGDIDPADLPPRSASQRDAFARLVPLQREGTIRECGDAALFLASDLAAYVTGVSLPVDGGTMAAGGWIRAKTGGWTLAEGLFD